MVRRTGAACLPIGGFEVGTTDRADHESEFVAVAASGHADRVGVLKCRAWRHGATSRRERAPAVATRVAPH